MWRLTVVLLALLGALASEASAQQVRVTTWNLEWFPSGSPDPVPLTVEESRVAAAANALRTINPDVILLQEVRDWDACERLAAALLPRKYFVLVCSAFPDSFSGGIGRQQVAILAKTYAQAAWAERWTSMGRVDPPRGFAFAAIRFGSTEIGFYSVHLKSNLVTGSAVLGNQSNIAKREVAAQQLVKHISDVETRTLPSVRGFVVGGDFNTNHDQPLFVSEKTLELLKEAAFEDVFAGVPLTKRITHPGKGKYPDATFDFLFLRGPKLALPARVDSAAVSDHLAVTADLQIGEANGFLRPSN